MRFCYEVRVPHNLAYLTDDGNLTRDQVVERAKAILLARRKQEPGEWVRMAGCDWDEAEVSEAKDDY